MIGKAYKPLDAISSGISESLKIVLLLSKLSHICPFFMDERDNNSGMLASTMSLSMATLCGLKFIGMVAAFEGLTPLPLRNLKGLLLLEYMTFAISFAERLEFCSIRLCTM